MIVFDICGTLYRVNTTFEFCEWFESRFFHSLLLRGSKSFFGKVLNYISVHYFDVELTRRVHLHTLKNMPVDIVEEKAKEFVSKVLVDKEIEVIHSLLGARELSCIVLVSATIEPVAKAIASILSVDHFYATSLEVEAGKYTGKIKKDLLGNKHKLFKGKALELVVTDNKSDLELCRQASEVVIISKSSDTEFWKQQQLPNCSILEV